MPCFLGTMSNGRRLAPAIRSEEHTSELQSLMRNSFPSRRSVDVDKGKFIAPNDGGEWKVHLTAEGPDWSKSIRKTDWIREIAWTSRRIAAKAGCPVVVMWFVDLPKTQSRHAVLPWYHEQWAPASAGYKRAVRRKKLLTSEFREVKSRRAWDALKSDVASGTKVERVYVNPDESEVIRDRDSVEELANHAREPQYEVKLAGGLLSTAFYIPTNTG